MKFAMLMVDTVIGGVMAAFVGTDLGFSIPSIMALAIFFAAVLQIHTEVIFMGASK